MRGTYILYSLVFELVDMPVCFAWPGMFVVRWHKTRGHVLADVTGLEGI